MFPPYSIEAAKAVGDPQPAACTTLIRYAFSRPLDFDPGTRYGYSNLGYCILGRVVEWVAGVPFTEYAHANVLTPAGAARISIGGSSPDERADGEVRYYDHAGAPLVLAEGLGLRERVPRPDGGIYLPRLDSAAGWIASPIDYAKFMAALFGRRGPSLLKPETLALMTSRPAPPAWEGSPFYYGLGWSVRPVSAGMNVWHFGSLPGTRTVAEIRADGVIYVALFNSRPPQADVTAMGSDVEQALNRAGNATKSWPTHDLFSEYP
jgi:N-acyl-D-amino-acid deacylase